MRSTDTISRKGATIEAIINQRNALRLSKFKGWQPSEIFVYYLIYAKKLSCGRLETWPETVSRFVRYIHKRVPLACPATVREVEEAILNREIVPSMRLMQHAGPLVDRLEPVAYNCSFVAINNLAAIGEVLFLTLCGVGVGFEITHWEVNKLPRVSVSVKRDKIFYRVEDNREGWGESFSLLVRNYWKGIDVDFDVSSVRPKGEPIASGGYCSGPEALLAMFDFVRDTLDRARKRPDRKVRPIDIFDMICYSSFRITKGSRRVALLSLSDAEDQEMAKCKWGYFWKDAPWRTVCNNSVKYHGRPSREVFEEEWRNLVEGKSGERGIFNADNFTFGNEGNRRSAPAGASLGTNPCGEINLRSCQFCNLSEVIVRPGDTLATLKRKIRLTAIIGTWQAALTNFPARFLNRKWRKNCNEERLLGVSLSGCYNNIALLSSENLRALRHEAITSNVNESKRIGQRPAKAVTCIKPSGTVSNLVGCSPGIHKYFAPFFKRRFLVDTDSNVANYFRSVGFPVYNVSTNTNNVYVEFGRRSMARQSYEKGDAVEQLETWKHFKLNFTEHNPSFTCLVGTEEWETTGQWVWDNFDYIGGVSFLPRDDHVYEAAPYERIGEEEYLQLRSLENRVDWEALNRIVRSNEGEERGGKNGDSACDKSLA